MPQTFTMSGIAKSAPWMGRRIRSKVTNLDTSTVTQDNRFFYDGWNLLTELDASNARVRTFLWGSDLSGSMQGAGGVGGLLKVTTQTPSASAFVAYDGNGNVAALVDCANGTQLMRAQYEYGPFGELVRSSGSMARVNPFRFSTKYQDDESDLLYYGYRYYNPSTGRWLSRDPIEEKGGVNLYSFVNNRPVGTVDALGLEGRSTMPKINGRPYGGCFCGPEVTAPLQRTMDRVAQEFYLWTERQKWSACEALYTISDETGVSGGQAWNMEWVYAHGRRDEIASFRGRCYFLSALNYALWGRANRLCDKASWEHGWKTHYPKQQAINWAFAFKVLVNHDPSDRMVQALAFTEWGYDGGMTHKGIKDTTWDLREYPERSFSWKWAPNRNAFAY